MGDTAYFRRLRQRMLAEGKCTACRKRPHRLGQTKCEGCATKQAEHMRVKQTRHRERRECVVCGVKLHKSIKMIRCPVCQERTNYLIQLGRKMG